jgi:inner membrane protein
MMGGSHLLLGLGAWSAAAPLLGTRAEPFGLALAALGALLPDIDHPGSWVGRRLLPVSVPLAAVFGHRGLTHSLLAVGGGILALRVEGLGWGAPPLAVGYLSHLVGDLVSGGVPLLWPSRRLFSLPLCRTGSLAEMGIVGAATLWLLSGAGRP